MQKCAEKQKPLILNELWKEELKKCNTIEELNSYYQEMSARYRLLESDLNLFTTRKQQLQK
mgnify:FL=1